MKVCSYCGRASEDSIVLCGECGTPFPSEIRQAETPAVREQKMAVELARRLQATKPWEAAWRVFVALELRLLPLKLLPLGATAIAVGLRAISWEFAAGLLTGFVLFEFMLFRNFQNRWAPVRQWVNWNLVEVLGNQRSIMIGSIDDGASSPGS